MEDNWFWCPSPSCGVRQWFTWVSGNIWRCSHCKAELEMSRTNHGLVK